MPQQSKYSNAEIEALMAQIFTTLETGGSSTDMQLMVLGNCITQLLQEKVPSHMRKGVAEKFSEVLLKSIN